MSKNWLCVLKASMVECWSILLIDTIDRPLIYPWSTLDRYLIETSVDIQLTLDRHFGRQSVMRVKTPNQHLGQQCMTLELTNLRLMHMSCLTLGGLLTDYWLRACLQGRRVTLASGLTLAGGQEMARVYKQNFTGRVTLQSGTTQCTITIKGSGNN